MPSSEELEDMSSDQDQRDVHHDLEDALHEMNHALPRYAKADEYFRGEAPEKFLSPAIQKLLTGSETDFKINFAGRIVNAVLDRLKISSVTAEDALAEDTDPDEIDNAGDGTSTTGDDPDEDDRSADLTEILNDLVWHRNELDIEAPEIHEKAVSLGDAYLFAWESDEDDGVDIFYNSPISTRILYEQEQPRTKRLAIKQWELGKGENARIRVNLYYPEGTYKLITKPKKKGRTADEFEVFTDEFTDENGFVENPWGEIPVFHFRTARPYGRPEHEQAYGAQDATTKLITNQMAMSDFAAFPQRWALTEDGSPGVSDNPEDWGDAPSQDTGKRQSSFVASPGSLWMLDRIKEMGEFAAADVSQLMEPLAFYIAAMAAITGTPLSYFGQIAKGMQNTRESGESLRQDREPLEKKIEARQKSFEAAWRDVLEFSMRILGFDDVRVNISWEPFQTVTDEAGWKGVQEQQRAGVPTRQTLLEAGYTTDQLDAWGYTEENPDGEGGDDEPPELPPGFGPPAPAPAAPAQPEGPVEGEEL